jgi:hypothetical protein
VWEVTTPSGERLYYVGRTGDSSSTNAQSPFNRMGHHLGFAKNSNMIRRHLEKYGASPESCHFRLVSYGPIEEESPVVGRAEHDERRDQVAAMERALAEVMCVAGYRVVNTVKCRKHLDAERFSGVLAAFGEAFPRLSTVRAVSKP